MIRRIYSSLPSFKSVKFKSGLNILMADKTPGASEQHTRNRAGKSSFVELVHFVCGANVDSDSITKAPEVINHSFGLELDIFDEPVRVSRRGSAPSMISIETAPTVRWLRTPTIEKDSNRATLSTTNWRTVLGNAYFGLGDPDADDSATAQPTFRALFAYFARREASGGMRDPMRSNDKQQLGAAQIAVSYLVGLDWSLAQEWERVRDTEKGIRELKRIVGQGLLRDVLDTAASLRSKVVVAEEKLARTAKSLSTFRVHEQYDHIEREAAELSRRLAALSDDNTLDRTYADELEAAMAAETAPSHSALEQLYAEVGIVLPHTVLQRYDDVVAFHSSVVRNRRSYLESELATVRARMEERKVEREAVDRRRSDLLALLKSHGALDQFVRIQAEHGRLQGEVEALRKRYEAAAELESTSTAMSTARASLVERLRREFDERADVLRDAITSFNDIVEELYGEPGNLEFHPTPNGPDIKISIQGDRSRGIGNMEIFCFDMMLMRMCARQNIGPGFLIHDSHLFDGVDSRQIARALLAGARIANELGFQYIVTLNSDVFEELPANLALRQHVLDEHLTDASDDGGLFGIRFEPPRPPPEPKPKSKPAPTTKPRRKKAA